MRRLKNETNDMIDGFAILIVKTLGSLRRNAVQIGDLKALLKYSSDSHKKSKLTNKLSKVTDFNKVFDVLRNFWSFFHFKILGAIIKGFCKDLMPDFEEYVAKFKEYCNRRVCEVPDDSYSKGISESERKKILYIQIDRNFIEEIKTIKLKDVKKLSEILEDILKTKLRVLEITDGSIILSFLCLHELDVLFPLSSTQVNQLQEIGVIYIYREHEYYRYSPLPPNKEQSSRGIPN